MQKNRLEAFSDGVIAIALTIMVLEIKVPEWATFIALMNNTHEFISYIFSFIFISIYWNTHHHLFHSVEKINGKVLWANNFFLFCITLVSFSTGWLAKTEFSRDSIILYGVTIILCWLAYSILTRTLVAIKENSLLRKAVWNDTKSKISLGLLVLWTISWYLSPYMALWLFSIVILLWIIPDPRIEKALTQE